LKIYFHGFLLVRSKFNLRIIDEWQRSCDLACIFFDLDRVVDEILFNLFFDAIVFDCTVTLACFAVSTINASVEDFTSGSFSNIETVFVAIIV